MGAPRWFEARRRPQASALRFDHGRKLDGAGRLERVHHGPTGVDDDSEHSTGSAPHGGGHADHVYSVAEGATSPPGIEEISSSWQRSANKYRVDPVDSPGATHPHVW